MATDKDSATSPVLLLLEECRRKQITYEIAKNREPVQLELDWQKEEEDADS